MHRKWLLDVPTSHQCVSAHMWHWTAGTEDYVREILNERFVPFTLSCMDVHSCGQFKHNIRIKKEITYCPWTLDCIAENKTKQMLIKLFFSKSLAENYMKLFWAFISSVCFSWHDIWYRWEINPHGPFKITETIVFWATSSMKLKLCMINQEPIWRLILPGEWVSTITKHDVKDSNNIHTEGFVLSGQN